MLLRASGEKAGEKVDLDSTVGRGGDGGVPHGQALVRFGEAVTRGSGDTDRAREVLLRAVGPAAFMEAASIVGIFNGLVRTADASGIPLDDGTRDDTADLRGPLGLNDYAGAANTDLSAPAADPRPRDVARLFE